MKYAHFGEWLAFTRKRRKLTQAQLANASGLNSTYISKIERNEIDFPRDVTRESLHMALGTSEDDLVDLGWLERIDSIEPGGQPYYIESANITPGERAAEEAHRIHDGKTPYDAPQRHAALVAQLSGYGLTTGQIAALLAVLDAFTESDT